MWTCPCAAQYCRSKPQRPARSSWPAVASPLPASFPRIVTCRLLGLSVTFLCGTKLCQHTLLFFFESCHRAALTSSRRRVSLPCKLTQTLADRRLNVPAHRFPLPELCEATLFLPFTDEGGFEGGGNCTGPRERQGGSNKISTTLPLAACGTPAPSTFMCLIANFLCGVLGRRCLSTHCQKEHGHSTQKQNAT